MKTTRRGLFGLFAAAAAAPAMLAKAAETKPMPHVTPGPPRGNEWPVDYDTGGGHTHSITPYWRGHGHYWDGNESLDHKHSIKLADGRIWVLG